MIKLLPLGGYVMLAGEDYDEEEEEEDKKDKKKDKKSKKDDVMDADYEEK